MELFLFIVAGAVFVAGLGRHQIDLPAFLKRHMTSLFGIPNRLLDRFNRNLRLRQSEQFKNCECCTARIRQSDALCAHCKLEISLGKSIQISKE